MRPTGRRIIDQQRAAWRKDTPQDIEWRIKSREAAERGMADRRARFPVLTATNADDAIRFQEERIRFHEAALGLKK